MAESLVRASESKSILHLFCKDVSPGLLFKQTKLMNQTLELSISKMLYCLESYSPEIQ